RVALDLSGTILHERHVEACPDIGPVCARDPAPGAYQHDQHLYSLELGVDAELGLLPHLALNVTFGIRSVVERIQFLDLQGASYVPTDPDSHHKNETLVGPTDPWVMLLT